MRNWMQKLTRVALSMLSKRMGFLPLFVRAESIGVVDKEAHPEALIQQPLPKHMICATQPAQAKQGEDWSSSCRQERAALKGSKRTGHANRRKNRPAADTNVNATVCSLGRAEIGVHSASDLYNR